MILHLIYTKCPLCFPVISWSLSPWTPSRCLWLSRRNSDWLRSKNKQSNWGTSSRWHHRPSNRPPPPTHRYKLHTSVYINSPLSSNTADSWRSISPYLMLQTKDLTSSLLNMTTLNSLSLANTARPAPVQGNTMSAFPSSSPVVGSMGTPVSNGFNAPMGFQTGGMGMGMGMRPTGPGLYGGMATTTSTPNFGVLTQNHTSIGQTNKAPDMSALDSLFTPSKPKVSLNQMGPIAAPATNTPWLNQYGSAQKAQTQMQGMPVGSGGVPTGFGMQANPFFSPQNFSQPAAAPSMNQSGVKHSASVNNDLKDLFG